MLNIPEKRDDVKREKVVLIRSLVYLRMISEKMLVKERQFRFVIIRDLGFLISGHELFFMGKI